MFITIISLLVLCCLHPNAAAEEFTGMDDYLIWAFNEGYPQGLLVPLGINGINQDYFHSLPDSVGYSSGKIVIGDSRCCQLGIWQSRNGTGDFAAFAVWGGHYVAGTGTPAMTWQLLSEVEECFHTQIRTQGKCTVFFFATVNDYDYSGYNNSGYISAAVASAEMIASMTYEYEGAVYHPEVIVIGFDGAQMAGTLSGFNRFVDAYNMELRDAVSSSPVLKENASLFTTVPEITGGRTTFISDGLHYSDATLQKIADHMKAVIAGGAPLAEVTAEEKGTAKAAEVINQAQTYKEPFLILYRIGE